MGAYTLEKVAKGKRIPKKTVSKEEALGLRQKIGVTRESTSPLSCKPCRLNISLRLLSYFRTTR